MKGSYRIMLLALLLTIGAIVILSSQAVNNGSIKITGAGSTFIYPLYTQWTAAYRARSKLTINYQPMGSGGGIKQIKAKTVDFGASDKPLTASELSKNHLVQFPTVIGAIVPIINLPGVQSGELKLSGSVLADIYLGHITHWDDPAIQRLNPHLVLPHQDILVVYRSDGSGTTFLFTNYLTKVSKQWATTVGSDMSVAWPIGIGGKGSEGVAAFVQRFAGSIGYLEYAYAQHNHLNCPQLRNKSGFMVTPNVVTFKAAADHVKWQSESHFAEILTDEPGAQSWPIIGATFILMQAQQRHPHRAKALLQFFDWSYTDGTALAEQLVYIPLPNEAIKIIENYWHLQVKDLAGRPLWSPAIK